MRELVWDLLNSRLSRRGFLSATTAAGYTAAAAQSALQSVAPADSGQESDSPLTRMVTATGAELMLEQLTKAGMRYLFVACTSGLGPVCDALVARPNIQLIQGTHEGIVVAVASGYAMATGKPAFAMFASEGLPNAASNFYNSMKDRTPLVVMSAGEGEGGRGGTDFAEAVKPFTKLCTSCIDPARVPEAIHTATKAAGVLPGGPTQIGFSGKALGQKASATVFSAKAFDIPIQLRPDSKDVERAARLLLNSTSPLMLVGSEVSACGAMASMVKLAELLGMPVESSKTWGADFPSFHPLFLGKEPLAVGGYRYPKKVDCFVNFGAHFGATRLASGTPIIQASVDPQSIGLNKALSVALVGHLDLVARQLIEAIQSLATPQQIEAKVAPRRAACGAFTKANREARFAMARKATGEPVPWYRAMVELNDLLDQDAVVVPEIDDDVQVTHFLNFADDGKLKLGRTTGSALGWGVGAAAGAKLALPNRQVMAFQGDGSFLFGQGESLWTISRYDLPILIVIHNNLSYEIPRWHIMQEGASGDARRDYIGYLGDPDVDFAKLASAFNIKGEMVRNTDQLRPAIQRGIKTLKDGRPYLLDIRTKPVGIGAEVSWYPKFSLASTRTRKV